jgi:cytochrome P450 / NADPH-cytochrome P450 reductase
MTTLIDTDENTMTMTTDLPIPGPAPKPLIGNARDIDTSRTLESIMELARRHGPIFRLRIPGSADRIIVSGSDLVAEVCDPERFDKLVTGGLSEVRRDPESAGLFTAETDNPLWRRAHNILMPSFGRQGLSDYHPEMVDVAQQMMDKWSRLNPGETIDVSDDMTRLTLDTIALCGFSYRFNSFYRETEHPFVAAMVRTLGEAQARSRQLPIAKRLRFRAARQMADDNAYMEHVVDEIIAARRQDSDGGHHDLLDAMLNGVDRQSGERLPDVNIRAQCITFLIAGHETTSGLLTFAVHFLLKHPEVAARAQREVDEVLGTDPAVQPSAAHVRKLTYVAQILDETLRLWPTAPGFTRTPLADTTLGGRYHLPQGSSVIVLTPALHRDRSIWGEDAEQFNPDHFAPERRQALPPHAFYPFGAGQRACIGRQFAMQEATLVLGMMLQRFDLVGPSDYQLKIAETLTIKPIGLKLRVRAREGRTQGAAPVQAPALAPVAGSPDRSASPATELPAGAHATPLLILYGSNLGATEQLAADLAQQAIGRGFRATTAALDDRVDELPHEGATVVLSSTYNGTAPDNAVAFSRWLARDGVDLRGVRYALFGCGSRDWAATYQAVPTLLDERLTAAGAERLAARGEGDAAGDLETQWEEWTDSLWTELGRALSLGDSVTVARPAPRALTLRLHNRQTANPAVLAHQAKAAQVISNHALYDHGLSDGSRAVRHIEVRLPEGATYATGDHLGVIPRNRTEVVGRVMRHFALDPGLWVEIGSARETHPHLPSGETPLLAVLAGNVDLQAVVSRSDIALLVEHTDDEAQREELRGLAGEGYEPDVVAPRRSLIDLLQTHPACHLPFDVFLSRLPALRPRYYSISSSPLAGAETCTVTVGVRTFDGTQPDDRAVGVCSGYLEGRDAQSTIFAFVRSPSIPFHPPACPRDPMIMVAAGTGLAPFRGFLQEQARRQDAGMPIVPSILFFGLRDPARDLLYGEELREYERRGLVHIVLAPSQAPGIHRTYVQDAIIRESALVHATLEEGARIYVCGDAQRMAPAVRAAFEEVVRRHEGDGQAEGWLARMRDEDRYLEDIWGSAGR